MSRHPHYLKHVHGSATPANVIALAVQVRPGATQQELADLSVGKTVPGIVTAWHGWSWRWRAGQVEGEREYSSQDPLLFWAWLGARLHPKSCTWVFVPRAYQAFVALGGFAALSAGRLVLEQDPETPAPNGAAGRRSGWRGYMIAQDPPTIILCRPAGTSSTIKWIDTENYGVKIDTAGKPVHEQVRDVHAFLVHYHAWLTQGNLGSWQHTAGSQAMHSFRRRFYRGGILVHDVEAVLDLERKSFYGGRCEVRQLGVVKGPIYHLDLNSAYMHVAGQADVPVALKECRVLDHWEDFPMPGPGEAMTARVEVETPEPLYPVRVWSDRKHQPRSPLDVPSLELVRGQTDVYYPIGRFETVLAWPELERAMRLGHVRRILAWSMYHAKPIFAGLAEAYAGWLASAPAQTCPAYRQMLKHFGVCLFGKFASWRRSWRSVEGFPRQEAFASWWGLHPDTKELVQFRSILGQVQYRERLGEHNESCPAIAAHVTSAARMYLWDLIQAAGVRHVMYYDTDSLWCTEQGYCNLNCAGHADRYKMGKLKLVATHQEVEFRGIKHYLADGQLVCAGLPDDAELDGAGTASWLSQTKMEEALCHKEEPQSRLRKNVRRWQKRYKHGSVDERGRVSPWRLQAPQPDDCPI